MGCKELSERSNEPIIRGIYLYFLQMIDLHVYAFRYIVLMEERQQ